MEQLREAKYKSKVTSFFILGVFIALGLSVLGYLLGHSILQAKKLERIVTVKGLSERSIKADLAIWPVTFKGSGNDLQAINSKIESDREKIIKFLVKQGFQQEEIEVGNYSVTDLMSREYRNKEDEGNRYIITAVIELKTHKVDLAKKAYQQVVDLIREGIVVEIGDNYSYKGLRFDFTKLNEIKLEMLAEANKNSRKAAEQFALDSSSKVGSIKKGNQGAFSVEPLYSNELSGYNEYEARSSLNKKVRVVVTTEYYLVD